MALKVEKVDVWAAAIEDQPGGLAGKLDVLAEAGADLEFIIARRSPDKPGTGVVFVTPLKGDEEIGAAAEVAGFADTPSLHSVRIEGDNQAGIAARLTLQLADAGINLRGLSAAVIGERFVAHLAFDSEEDAAKAIDRLRTM
jgi:hypothetical protein